MEIELKNGEELILEVSSLILEYLEEYKGGLKQLKKDAEGEKDENGYTRTMRATNHLIYSVIACNYKEPLTYRQAVGLVKLEDVDRITKFVIDNTPSLKNENISKNIYLEENTHRF